MSVLQVKKLKLRKGTEWGIESSSSDIEPSVV